jgi:hypothetical protein
LKILFTQSVVASLRRRHIFCFSLHPGKPLRVSRVLRHCPEIFCVAVSHEMTARFAREPAQFNLRDVFAGLDLRLRNKCSLRKVAHENRAPEKLSIGFTISAACGTDRV